MFYRSLLCILILLLVGCLVFQTGRAYENEAHGTLSIEFGSGNTNSFGISAEDPSNSGLAAQSVNLYTGQHVESFPLFSLKGRGNLGVSMSLDYNGNVSLQAKSPNTESQAPPFGLGFSVGMISVVVDHRGTADIYDDFYSLIDNTGLVALKVIDDTAFVAEDGRAWRIKREIAPIGGRDCVIGWTIRLDDGTVWRLGDFDTDLVGWNATRNVLRFGSFVGNARTAYDTIHANQWALKVVHDADSLNWINFAYTHDSRHLKVRDLQYFTDKDSDNSYSCPAKISTIATADGRSIAFIYDGDRPDVQRYLTDHKYDLSDEFRIKEIVSRDSDGNTLATTKFGFRYLNYDVSVGDDEQDSVWIKSLLTDVQMVSAAGDEVMPSLQFDYYTDKDSPSFGSIKSIYYPSGAVKEIKYKTIEDEVNFATLDQALGNDPSKPTKLFATDNMYVYYEEHSNPAVHHWHLGYWDGYWNAFNSAMIDNNPDSRPGLSPDGWVVGQSSDDPTYLVVYRIVNGGLVKTLIPNAIDDTNDDFHFITGKDCFLMVPGDRGMTGCDNLQLWVSANTAKYFTWDDGAWTSVDVVHAGGFLGSSRMRNDMYIMSLWDGTSCKEPIVWVEYGKHDRASNTITRGSESFVTNDYHRDLGLVIGHDYVGAECRNFMLSSQWTGSGWSEHLEFDATGHRIWSLAQLPNGFTYNRAKSAPDFGLSSAQVTMMPQSNELWRMFGGYNQLEPHPLTYTRGTNHYLLVGNAATRYFGVYPWEGWDWSNTFSPQYLAGSQEFSNFSLSAFDECFVIGPAGSQYNNPHLLAAKRFGENGVWGSQLLVSLLEGPYHRYAATKDYFLCRTTDSKLKLYLHDPFNFPDASGGYKPFVIDDPAGTSPRSRLVAVKDHFYHASQEAIGGTPQYFAGAHTLYDTLFSGKAKYPVVDTIKTYEFPLDQAPVMQHFTYWGGILDREAKTPRFARTKVSTPYSPGGDPEGFSVHFFYGDIDSSMFTFEEIFDSLPHGFRQLDAASLYGVPNGGYYLDGLEYLSYTYTVGDDVDKMQDSTISYYSTYRPESPWGIPEGVYRVRLDSVHTRSDSLTTDITYLYDTFNGQVEETRTRYQNADTYFKDRRTFAYPWYFDLNNVYEMRDHFNAITQVAAEERSFVTPGTDSFLSKTSYQWEKYGSYKALFVKTHREQGISPSYIYTKRTLDYGQSYDEFGNEITAIDVQGDTSSAKMSPDGTQVTGTITNGFTNSAFIFGAEYDLDLNGESYDGWVDVSDGDGQITDTASFTGERSYALGGEPGSVPPRGMCRAIVPDSLQGSQYAISFWAKGEPGSVLGVEAASHNSSTTAIFLLEREVLDCSDWQQFEYRFTLLLTSDSAVVTLEGGAGAVLFDDVRLYPVSAQMSTAVYDKATGLVTSESGVDNIPVRTEYDKFHRPIETRNFKNELVSTTERGLARDSLVEEAYGQTVYGDGPDYEMVEVSLGPGQQVQADLQWSYWGWGTISINRIHRRFPDEPGYPDDSDTLTILARTCYLDTLVRSERHYFYLPMGDTILIKGTAESGTLSATVYYSGVHDGTYQNWTKNTTYSSDTENNVSVTYYDGLGRTLQTRIRDSVGVEEVALVTDVAEYDTRSRVVKAYKPYLDEVGGKGVTDFSDLTGAISEAGAYYDADRCPDCGTYVYSENAYTSEFNSKIESAASPGIWHNMTTGRATSYDSWTDEINEEYVSKVVDPDGIESRTVDDHWGEVSDKVSYFDAGGGLGAGTMTIRTESDPYGNYDSVFHVTDTSRIALRSSQYDDLGRVESTWKIDYGTIRMTYDHTDNIRFMQNDQRHAEGNFVYRKYDPHGRMIEEGVMTGNSNITQTNALDPDYPTNQTGQYPTYKWYYDHYDGGSYSILAPGKLVRVENADATYYREFYYSPEELSDSVVVKLPFDSVGVGELKAIVHKYNRDLTLKELIVFPDITDNTTARGFLYDYDAAGRLQSIVRNDPNSGADPMTFGEYTYNAEGSVEQARIGVDQYDNPIQVLDYTYDALGRLIAINDPATVVTSNSGIGAANDHFGQEITYNDGTAGYFNGRIFQIRSVSSNDGVANDREFEYSYNDLGWLDRAMVGDDDNEHTRRFQYNPLGQRTSRAQSTIGNPGHDSVNYEYHETYDGLLGSSRMSRIDNQGQHDMLYDTLGNLVKDRSRLLDTLTYDYRNLLNYVFMTSINVSTKHDILRFSYNESGNRIKKVLNYWHWDRQYPPCPEALDSTMGTGGLLGGGMMMMMGGIPPIEDPFDEVDCPVAFHAEKLYLYDGGVLLATFDKDDNVNDLFVNGPGGRLATYYQNNTAQLYFFINDYLGSARALVDNTGQTQYYDYYAFGEILQAAGSHGTQFQFTGKERDDYGEFEFDYFGARYYDARIGSFSSIDKAGQFANGYVYGANNPVMIRDRDGNLGWLAAALLWTAFDYGVEYVLTGEINMDPGVFVQRFAQNAIPSNLVKKINNPAVRAVVQAGLSTAIDVIGDGLRGEMGTASDYLTGFTKRAALNYGVSRLKKKPQQKQKDEFETANQATPGRAKAGVRYNKDGTTYHNPKQAGNPGAAKRHEEWTDTRNTKLSKTRLAAAKAEEVTYDGLKRGTSRGADALASEIENWSNAPVALEGGSLMIVGGTELEYVVVPDLTAGIPDMGGLMTQWHKQEYVVHALTGGNPMIPVDTRRF